MMQGAAVDTKCVSSRRAVHLHSLDELADAVESVYEAAAAGTVRSLGNWSPEQVLWHIGKFVELSFDGFPFRYRRGPVWIMRLFKLLAWRRLIALALRPGFRNPSYAAVLEPDPATSLDHAAALLRRQIGRIRSGERMTQSCSVDGPYTHDEWVYIHLRHAELHLSFLALAPDSGSS